jgi:hypothetical protein
MIEGKSESSWKKLVLLDVFGLFLREAIEYPLFDDATSKKDFKNYLDCPSSGT